MLWYFCVSLIESLQDECGGNIEHAWIGEKSWS